MEMPELNDDIALVHNEFRFRQHMNTFAIGDDAVVDRARAMHSGARRWVRLERQHLSKSFKGRFCNHRDALERAPLFRPQRHSRIRKRENMTTKKPQVVRCAIYTRVSTDQGLDQEFNSLDAQYDASKAYIRSQAHAGWSQIRARYDDGGFSGGNTDRPALQQLLEDIRAGKLDVIVVYKVDRLTRSLADFAKLVELFDKHSVSFVSVTQQFHALFARRPEQH